MPYSWKKLPPALYQYVKYQIREEYCVGFKSMVRHCREKGYRDPNQILDLAKDQLQKIIS